MQLATALIVLSAFANSAMSPSTGQQTADALSTFTMIGVRSELVRAGRLDAAQSRCVAALDDSAFGPAYLPLLQRDFAEQTLAGYDAFFESELGQRYLDAFVASPATAGYGAGTFTRADVAVIQRTMNDPEFVGFAERTKANQPRAALEVVRKRVQECHQAR